MTAASDHEAPAVGERPVRRERNPRISVIVPTRNEEDAIRPVLQRVLDEQVWEVIVVDGGSADATRTIATSMGAMVLSTEPGRGHQLNAGAAAATGDIFLFLHADTFLHPRFHEHVARTLSYPGVVAGAFRLLIDAPGRSFRLIERLVRFRSHFLQMPYGDQAIFVRAETFRRIGGFPNWPLLEDYALVRRLRRLGRIRITTVGVLTSGRRWIQKGIWRTTLTNQLCLAAFRLGVSPKRLAEWRDGNPDLTRQSVSMAPQRDAG